MNIFNDPEVFTALVLPVACVLFIAASVLALVRVHLVLRAETGRATLASDGAVESRIQGLGMLMQDMLTRQAEIAVQVLELQQRIEAVGRTERLVVEPATRTSSMEHAARLARDGASIDELSRSCGLNLGEASLLLRLHGHEAAAA